jgi:DNA-binding transcriptional ArsR family regulator
MHPSELRLRLLGYYVRYFRRATPPEVIAAAAAGGRQAAEQFKSTSYADDLTWQAALDALLPLTAWETRRRLLRLLRRWDEVFRVGFDAAALDAETAALRLKARGQRPEQVIALVMDGWDYVPEPGINAVLLIPSRAIWPYSHVFDHHSTKLICYPIAPSALPDAALPPGSLLARSHAIADERRLRVLRLLAREELSAAEIAARLAIGLTTLMHHLGLLREAGLVTASAQYRKRYRLRREALAELGRDLERFLDS